MDPIYIQHARLSFPHLTQAHQSGPNSAAKFSADLLLPVSDTQVSTLEQAGLAIAAEISPQNPQQVITLARQDRQLRSFGPGELKVKADTGQPYDGYVGHFFVSASNQIMPQMVRADGKPIDPANQMEAQAVARTMYGGCYVNAAIKPWPQNNTNGRAVRWELVAIQFAADGEAFGSGAPADVSGMFGQATPAGVAAPIPSQPPLGASYQPPGMQPPAADPYQQVAQPPGMQPPSYQPQPVQGADGRWYDPISGQPVAPPLMPGYPPQQ